MRKDGTTLIVAICKAICISPVQGDTGGLVPWMDALNLNQTTSVTLYGTCVCLEAGIPQHSTVMRPKECQRVGEAGDVSVQSSKFARMLHSVLTMKGKIK